jgi:hypothetical protein
MKARFICLLNLLKTTRGRRVAVVVCSLLVLLARVDSQLLVQIQAEIPLSSSDDPFGLLGPDEDDDGLHVYAAKVGWSAFEQELRTYSSRVLGATNPETHSFETRIHAIPLATLTFYECQCRLGIGSLLRC